VKGLYVVLGVSGSGKSTIARSLASAAHGLFFDADDYHSAESKAKMAAGIPLTDEDRWPWLARLNELLRSHAASAEPTFLACSALRQVYRDELSKGLPSLRFIYLKGSRELIQCRLAQRHGHFMNPALLDSQFATLEEPPDAITVPIDGSVEEIVHLALAKIQ
jgi:gluconokinase